MVIALALDQMSDRSERPAFQTECVARLTSIQGTKEFEIDSVPQHRHAVRGNCDVNHTILQSLTYRDQAVGLGGGALNQLPRDRIGRNEIEVGPASRHRHREIEFFGEPYRSDAVRIEIM